MRGCAGQGLVIWLKYKPVKWNLQEDGVEFSMLMY